MKEQNGQSYEFDGFRIRADERLLTYGTRTVNLPPKAIDLLLVLLAHHGRVVSKDDLMRRVWSDTIVEEANLSHNIFLLRKALGAGGGYIETVSKRGYRFVGDVATSFGDATVFVSEQTLTRISLEEEIDTNGAADTAAAQISPAPGRIALFSMPFRVGAICLAVAMAITAAWFGFFRDNRSAASTEAPRFTRFTNSDKMLASTISPDGKFVAYGQNYTSGDGALYIRQVETNREMRLIEPAERFFGTTAFSPDGVFIYYIEHRKGVEDGALYRVSSLGGQPTKMLDRVNLMFGLSPDGLSVVFVRHDKEQKQNSLVTARLDGSGERVVLTRPYDELYLDFCPAWSPDGRLIAFGAVEKNDGLREDDYRTRVYTLELGTGSVGKVSDERWDGIGKLNWLADGSGLVFPGNLPRIGVHIYSLSYPEGRARRLTNELNNFGNYGLGVTSDGTALVADIWETSYQLWTSDADPAASMDKAERLTSGINDGEYGVAPMLDGTIVYASSSGDTTDLWRLRDGKSESLTTDDFTEFDVAAAPDGSFLVFGSNRAGNSHLFRMEMSDLSLRQLTFGEGFESMPDISPDGAWIVYNAGGFVWKMPSSGGDGVRLTDYEGVAPVFSPNGEMVACILPTEKVTENARLAIIPAAGGAPLKEFAVVPFGWYYRAPRWTPDGSAVTFRKIEKSSTNLWKQGLDGRPPVQITDFKSEYISNYAFSRDGQRLIAARGRFGGGVALIKNFK